MQVTPMLGLLAALREKRSSAEFHGSVTGPSVPQKVVFVWACRNASEFAMLDEHLLAESEYARFPDRICMQNCMIPVLQCRCPSAILYMQAAQ